MDKEMVQQIIASGSAVLSSLAQAAKTTGEHLYWVLVNYQVVNGIAGIVAWVSYLITVSFIGKFIFIKTNNAVKNGADEASWVAAFGVYFLLCVFLFFAWSQMQVSVEQILAPEYYAIKFLFESVKK